MMKSAVESLLLGALRPANAPQQQQYAYGRDGPTTNNGGRSSSIRQQYKRGSSFATGWTDRLTTRFSGYIAIISTYAVTAVKCMIIGHALLVLSALIYMFIYWLVMPTTVTDTELFFDYGMRGSPDFSRQFFVHPPRPPVAMVNLLTGRTQWKAGDEMAAALARADRHDGSGRKISAASRLLVPGQFYMVGVELDLPCSQANVDVGTFMVYTSLFDSNNTLLGSSARSAVMPHVSVMLQVIHMIFYWPLLLMGLSRERVTVDVWSFDRLLELKDSPLTKAKVLLSSPDVQLYGARLVIKPQLHGLQILMHDWFYTSAIFGILIIAAVKSSIGGFIYLMIVVMKDDANNVEDEDDDEDEYEDERNGGGGSRSNGGGGGGAGAGGARRRNGNGTKSSRRRNKNDDIHRQQQLDMQRQQQEEQDRRFREHMDFQRSQQQGEGKNEEAGGDTGGMTEVEGGGGANSIPTIPPQLTPIAVVRDLVGTVEGAAATAAAAGAGGDNGTHFSRDSDDNRDEVRSNISGYSGLSSTSGGGRQVKTGYVRMRPPPGTNNSSAGVIRDDDDDERKVADLRGGRTGDDVVRSGRRGDDRTPAEGDDDDDDDTEGEEEDDDEDEETEREQEVTEVDARRARRIYQLSPQTQQATQTLLEPGGRYHAPPDGNLRQRNNPR